MKQLFLTGFLKSKKLGIHVFLLLLMLLFSQSTLAYDLEGYKNTNPVPDMTVQTLNKPSVQDNNEGGSCVCECVNDQWVCDPGGCGLSGACGGAIESNSVPLNSRTIPAISQPSVTTPTREIDPKSLPGDQFDPKALPGDQFTQ